jgi:hypothetical protein
LFCSFVIVYNGVFIPAGSGIGTNLTSRTNLTVDNGSFKVRAQTGPSTYAVQHQFNEDGTSLIGNPTFTGIASGTFSGNGSALTALNANNLASGTIPDARFPATLPAVSGINLTALPATLPAASGVNLTALNASQLTSGTVPDARFPATLPAASGANLTALNGSQITSGTVADARLSAAVVLENAENVLTASNFVTSAGAIIGPVNRRLNALAYGATGKGLVDDRPALQAMFSAGSSDGTWTVYEILPGVYLVSRTALAQPKNGAFALYVKPQSIIRMYGATIKIMDSVGTANTAVFQTGDGTLSGPGHNYHFYGGIIDGNKTGRGINVAAGTSEHEGINLLGTTNFLAQDVWIRDCGADGIDGDGGTIYGTVSGVTITECGGNGMSCADPSINSETFQFRPGSGTGCASDRTVFACSAAAVHGTGHCVTVTNERHAWRNGATAESGRYDSWKRTSFGEVDTVICARKDMHRPKRGSTRAALTEQRQLLRRNRGCLASGSSHAWRDRSADRSSAPKKFVEVCPVAFFHVWAAVTPRQPAPGLRLSRGGAILC